MLDDAEVYRHPVDLHTEELQLNSLGSLWGYQKPKFHESFEHIGLDFEKMKKLVDNQEYYFKFDPVDEQYKPDVINSEIAEDVKHEELGRSLAESRDFAGELHLGSDRERDEELSERDLTASSLPLSRFGTRSYRKPSALELKGRKDVAYKKIIRRARNFFLKSFQSFIRPCLKRNKFDISLYHKCLGSYITEILKLEATDKMIFVLGSLINSRHMIEFIE